MTELIFDIETEGLSSRDRITVAGFINTDSEASVYHFLVPDQREADAEQLVTQDFRERIINQLPDWVSHEYHGDFIPHENESNLLDAVEDILAQENVTVIGFNSSNYDIPTIRTRCLINSHTLHIGSCRSIDVAYLYKSKFNTTTLTSAGFNKSERKEFGEMIGAEITSDMYSDDVTEAVESHGYTEEELRAFAEDNDLDVPTKQENGLQEIFSHLMGGLEQYDPFDDSAEATQAFANGNIEDVLVHNIIDLIATRKLYDQCNNYISQRELQHQDHYI